METNKLSQRKSPRASFLSYSEGDYFVTICTKGRKHYFGKIWNDVMYLNSVGDFCSKQFTTIGDHYPYAKVLTYVIMPNHIHAIIHIDRLTFHSYYDWFYNSITPQRTALSIIIGGLKRSITLFAHKNNIQFQWQPRYHDHYIRGENDRNIIEDYIKNNVQRWRSDKFYTI